MANQRIGIEVQVQFQTIKELQAELSRKLDDKLKLKVKLGVSQESLKELKSSVEKALDRKHFNINLNMGNVQKSLNKIQAKINKIDESLKKNRELKINFNVNDMNKSMKEIIKNSEKVDEEFKNQENTLKGVNGQIDKSISKVDKLVTTQKQLKNGTFTTTVKTVGKQDNGDEVEVTRLDDGRKTLKVTENRKKELQEIEKLMKSIHQLEIKAMDADKKSLQAINKELDAEKAQIKNLREMYKAKYNVASAGTDSTKELYRLHLMNKAIKQQAIDSKKVKEVQNEINSAISRNAQLEKNKQNIAKKMVTALEDEQKSLSEQYAHYNKVQDSLEKKYKLQSKMSDAQKKELENIKTIGIAQLQQAQYKKQQLDEEKKLSAQEKERHNDINIANKNVMDDLRKIHRLRQEIYNLENKKYSTSTDNDRLALLRKEKDIAENNLNDYYSHLSAQKMITKELVSQVDAQRKINAQEADRVKKLTEVQNKQAEANKKITQYKDITKQIGQLQRDLIYTGMRERTVIENQVSKLEGKRNAIKESLKAENQLTEAFQREIKAIEKAQAEQRKLNALRQDSREKDQSFNDTGGLIDPYNYMASVERGAREILEPVARLDEALVGVTKVADATAEQFKEFADSSYDAGSALGVTADQYILAVEKWVTAGKTFKESQEMANVSLVGSFVGNISPDEMVKYMSVPLNAFKDEALDAKDVINSMNEVANNNAIEMNDLGKAYVRSAGTAKDAGISFGELTGFITSAQEATRKGGERIGTGVKTIAMNIGNINAQMTAGEKRKFDFFSNIGVDFRDAEGDMLSATDIIGNLVDVYDDLSKEDKSTAKFYMAGKEHAEVLGAILANYDQVKTVDGEVKEQLGQGTTGSAYLEHAKQADSVKFKLAELKNAWDKLMYTIGGGQSGVGDVLHILTEGLEELTKLANNKELMNSLKVIFAGMGMMAGANLYKRFFDTILTGLGKTRRSVKETGALMKTLTAGTFLSGGGKAGRAGKGNDGSDDVTKNNTGNTTNTSGTTPTPTVVATGGTGNSKKQADELEKSSKSVDKVNGKLSSGFKLVGKFAGAIPFVGTALVALDVMGIPVFEKFGGWLDSLTTDTKEWSAELESANKKFLATNAVSNGSLIEKDSELNGKLNTDTGKRTGGIQQQFEKDTKSGGYLSEEEFLALQERFNALAEASNIDLKIEMNDTEHIKTQIDALNASLNGLGKESVSEFGDQYQEQIDTIMQANEDIATKNAELDYFEDGKARAQAVVDSYQKMIDGGELLTLSQMQAMENSQNLVDKYSGDIKRVKGEIEGNQDVIKVATENMGIYSKKLADYIVAGGDLAGMSKEQVVNALDPMIDRYNKLNSGLNKTKSATKNLNSTTKLSKDNYDKLIAQYPSLKSMSLDELNLSDKKRKKAQEIVKGERDKAKESRSTTKTAIDGLSKQGGYEDDIKVKIGENAKATGKLKEEIKKKNSEVAKTKEKVTTTWYFKIAETGKAIWNMIKKGFSNTTSTHTVQMNEEKGKSVSIGEAGVSRASTSANVSTGGALLKTPTSVKSLAKATKNNSRVSSDVSRYWSRETYDIQGTDDKLKDLTRAITDAKDNQSKLIKLYQQQQSLLKKQVANQKGLYNAKDSEMNSVLKKLKKYGFKVNTSSNKVTNLSNASKLKGTKAEEAEKLLNTWRSLYNEMNGIQDTMDGLKDQIKNINDDIKNAKIAKELESYEKTLKKVDALLTSISNKGDITSQRISLIDGNDKELELVENEKALNESKSNMKSLISQFNSLSDDNIKYEENGTTLLATMEKLGTEILKQSDSIIKYRQAINDLELARVTDDMTSFNTAIDNNSDKLKNNISNLQEGLLSGTDLSDLQSSISSGLDLNRDNKYETLAKERIALEKEVQDALDAFAKKNVDRVKKVSKSQLDITAKTYNQMLKMASNYTAKKTSTAKEIKSTFGDLIGIGNTDDDYKLVANLDKAFGELQDKQDKLTSTYEKNMKKALSTDTEDSLTNQYIIDTLKLQEAYFNSSITGTKKAISELKKQLRDSTLTGEQETKIREQIEAYEKDVTASQNSIKDTIAERFEFEFSLLDEAMSKYDKFATELEYAMSIVEALGGDNNETTGVLLQEMMDVEQGRNAELAKSLESLESQMNLYEKGSYEWNIINAEVEEYNKLLKDSNKELLEMNQGIMSNSFSGTMNSIQRKMFDGKTLDEYNDYQSLWMDGLEREIALEDAYQRMADLGTSMYNEKMSLLDKQEKLSKYEMDYLNKQLDLLELQQKLENLNKERTVQTLKQQTDGTWDWEYSADPEQISALQKELSQKELEIQQLEEKGREDYLSKLDSILGNAESGQYKNVAEFESAIDDLGEAYESLVGDIPEIKDEYLKELINAYSKYVNDNGGILDNIKENLTTSPVYEGFSQEVVKAFDDIGANMATIFADTLLKKIPNLGNNISSQNADVGKSVSINLDKVEFPNIKTADGIKEAILSLPQIALQKSREKI